MAKTDLVAWARAYKAARPEFPLTVLPSGYWCKKIAGRQVTFGRLDDPAGALAAYYRYLDGPTEPDALTVADGCGMFLGAQERTARAGGVSWGQVRAYRLAARRIVETFGHRRSIDSLGPVDFVRLLDVFRAARTGAGIRLHVVETRTMFRWLYANGHMDRPVRFGTEFRGPPARECRRAAEGRPGKLFEAAELRRLLDPAAIAGHFRAAAVPFWRAAILLGINGAFTQVDIAELPPSAVDLRGRMITFPRPKTGEARRTPLWAETVVAMQDYLSARPNATRGNLARFFLNGRGRPWVDPATEGRTKCDKIGPPFRDYCRAVGVYRDGRGFGALRHVVGTVGRETGELDAVELILGHVPQGITARHYLHRVPDEALQRVAEHVRKWTFGY